MVGTEHISSMLVPGVALSPDGSRLSVLYAEGGRLTTVDTATLRVVASRPVAAAPAATGWFGLAPIDAEAKYEEGVQWSLAYSPDGRHLLAWTMQCSVDNVGNSSQRGLVVKLIDPGPGVVLAKSQGLTVNDLFYAPDGSALSGTRRLANGGESLLRIDPTNLAVAARQDFTEPRTMFLLAR